MVYQSILGMEKPEELNPGDISMPGFFYDLNLDQVVGDILEEHKLYDLKRYYYGPLDRDAIEYRQGVLKDIDKPEVFDSISSFSQAMRRSREYLSYIEGCDNDTQIMKWNLDSAYSYVVCVERLLNELNDEQIESMGLTLFRDWLAEYTKSDGFLQLREDTYRLIGKFADMKFNIKIKRDRVIIRKGYLEEDYCKQLKEAFKVNTDDMHYYQNNPFGTSLLSPLEEKVLVILSKQYPEVFSELYDYDEVHRDFMDETVVRFEHEVQFYIAFRLYRDRMKDMGFHFCYPSLRQDNKLNITMVYDLALAGKNAREKKEVVFNDCYYNEGERFLIVTGPNQGGKTTYARALGQVVYFTLMGLMVPAMTAEVPTFDGIYTHFAVEENLDTGAGKLKEELIRFKGLMSRITEHSFVIINEIFTSAASYDAYIMGRKVIEFLLKLNCSGVYVTHIFELTKGDSRIVSMVAALLDDGSNIRTFRIERKPADGRSYANTIVEKHRMTYQEVKERISR